jgi:hypothetical protein
MLLTFDHPQSCRGRLVLQVAPAFVPIGPLPNIAPSGFDSGLAAQAAGRGWQDFLTAPIVQRPTGIAIDLRGAKHAAQWGYVADAGTGRIVKFGTGGRVLRSWHYAPPGHRAVLTVGGSGNLFVADELGGTISSSAPSASPIPRAALPGPRQGRTQALSLTDSTCFGDTVSTAYLHLA